jgi:hypothetical protein
VNDLGIELGDNRVRVSFRVKHRDSHIGRRVKVRVRVRVLDCSAEQRISGSRLHP